MRLSTTWLLLAAVLALGAFIRFYEHKADTTDRRQELARRAIRFDPAKVTTLRIVTDALQVALEKRGDQWQITSPVAARADAGEVSRVLDELELLERSEVITSRQQRKQQLSAADYGFDQPRARLVLGDGAREWTILVGRDAPMGGNLFLKEAADSSILVASTNVLARLPKTVADLRDRRLFIGYPGEATRLDLKRRDGLLQLARGEQGLWRVQKPFAGRAAYAGVQDLLDAVYGARAADFVADSFAAASLYGLDEPVAQVTVAGDRRHGEQVLLLGKPVDRNPDQVYATVQGTETVIAVDQKLLAALAVKADDLRDRRLLTMPAYEIGYIRVEEGERALQLVRQDGGGWEMTEPRQFTANDARLQAVLGEWTGLRIERFIDQPGTNLAALGLEPPARRVTFARKAPAAAGSKPDEPARAPAAEDAVTVLVADAKPGRGRITVKVEHEEPLYRVSDDGLRALPMTPLYYRDLAVLAIDPQAVRSLAVQSAGREEGAERDAPTNQFRAVTAAVDLDAEAVGQVVAAMCRLTAVDYVVEDPEDPSVFGVAPPEAVVTIGLSGQGAISKSLVLGAEAGPSTVFAMIRGLDMIFTIEKAVRDKLLQPLYKHPATKQEAPGTGAGDTHVDPDESPGP